MTTASDTVKLDAKFYGQLFKVKNDEPVGDDEWVAFLVKDDAFYATLPYYLMQCVKRGCDREQIDAVVRLIERATAWRKSHRDRLKVPDAAGEKLLDMVQP